VVKNVFGIAPLDAFINIFLLAVGEFQMDGFDDHPQYWMCYLFFLLATLLIQITLLNMLIAIMGETFERVIDQRFFFSLRNKLMILGTMASVIFTRRLDGVD